MVDCASRIEQFWSLFVTYADDQTGRIDNNSVRQASEDWRKGAIGDEELRTVTDAWRAGCELADAVGATISASGSGSTVTASAGIDAPGGGVEAMLEVTLGGASQQITATPNSDSEVTFEVDSGGNYEVCAEIVSVAPA